MKLRYLIAGLVLTLTPAVHAVEPSEMLADPALEARAREVSKVLRCVQCQNENIDDSSAEIAHDMRILVRKRIVAGDSNQQVVEYMHSRYGDFVLLKPRFSPTTVVLWCAPALLLIGGAFVLRRRLHETQVAPAPLSAEETAALAALDQTERSA